MITPDYQQDSSPPLDAHWLGSISYPEAYEIQRLHHTQRLAGEINDHLLLLEHPLVFTLPRRHQAHHLRVSRESLELNGATVVETDRGGQVTLHNPGQLVGYLIRQLEPGNCDLHHYLRWIEIALQEVSTYFGVTTCLHKGLTGVWVADRKLASIGVAVKRWVTLHGFAINVNNDLTPFTWIDPCGLAGVQMTSLSTEVGHRIEWEELLRVTCDAFGADPWAHTVRPYTPSR
jgi:lipoate-protein ligase B